jgi:carbon-monoxide dehydrogenase medium subunit
MPAQGTGSAYSKLAHPASRYAVIGCAASVTVANGVCSAATVVLGGLLPAPSRVIAVEQALAGKPLSEEQIAAAAARTAASLDGNLIGDIYASAEYRRAVAHVYVRRALLAAAKRAK